ncbi:uncharacterized protein N7503_003946 [Penicillium pulvis]|uniref:uncharacterized protein n=1 Tax=Penicillium pulvis TaxID=1562058 RepID=UPI0025492B0E|nr:uncharacterized protein N7503_003946 [Penicillium pulvis]KAJ5806344.1 hypothetical protein N7503_003946 [Penicillium pulvis]
MQDSYKVTFTEVGPSRIPELYANGLMPAPVRVGVQVYKDDKRLDTNLEWFHEHVRLINADDKVELQNWTSEDPATKWVSKFDDGGWEHASTSLAVSQEDKNSPIEAVVIYVATGTTGGRKIAAQVKIGNEKWTSIDEENHKSVQITAVTPIHYSVADIKTPIPSQQIKKGPWRDNGTGEWTQTNWYITNTRFPEYEFRKGVIYNIPEVGVKDGYKQVGLKGCFQLKDGPDSYSITTRHWYASYDSESTTMKVGALSKSNSVGSTTQITINQRLGTYVVVLFETDPIWALQSVPAFTRSDAYVRIYDKYGNRGNFALSTKNKYLDLVVKDYAGSLADENTESHAEVDEETKPLPEWVKDLPANVQGRLSSLSVQEVIDALPPGHAAIQPLSDNLLKRRTQIGDGLN